MLLAINNVIHKPNDTTKLYPKYKEIRPFLTYILAFLYSYNPASNLLSSWSSALKYFTVSKLNIASVAI